MVLRYVCLLMLLCLCPGAAARPAAAADTPPDAPAVRVVTLIPDQIVSIRTKVRYTTLLTLPEGDEIVDVTCGDREFWLVNVHPSARAVSVKPAKPESQSNLNILTTSGQVYTFLLQEISKHADETPDLSVHLQRDPLDFVYAARAPRYVPADRVDAVQRELTQARADMQALKAGAQRQLETAIAEDRAAYPASLKFAYRYKPKALAFRVKAMFHDDRFTYIQCDGELPAIYEVRDGGPALVHFDVKGHTYIVHKVLGSGYLAIGRERLPFTREAQ